MLSRALSQTYRYRSAFRCTDHFMKQGFVTNHLMRHSKSLTRNPYVQDLLVHKRSHSYSTQRYYSKKGRSDGNDTSFTSSIFCTNCGNPLKHYKANDSINHIIKCETCDITYLAIEKKHLPDAELSDHSFPLEVSQPIIKVPSPREIYDCLNECVIGQTLTKKVLSVHVYSHYKRILFNMEQEKQIKSNYIRNKTIDIMKSLRLDSFIKSQNSKEIGKDASVPIESQTKSPFSFFPSEFQSSDSFQESQFGNNTSWKEESSNLVLEKSNIIMIGPTGSGKTLLVQTLAKYLNVPIAICDCTSLTQAGFVGDDVESIIVRLYHLADCDAEKAQQGIIFLDEIDKISCSKFAYSTRDVTGEGVQQDLLKLLEGKTVTISSTDTSSNRRSMRFSSQGTVTIDTKNILFIGSGAFTKLEDIVRNRKHKQIFGFFGSTKAPNQENPLDPAENSSTSSTDYTEDEILERLAERDELLKQIEVCDLVQYGMIPEFMGRFPIMTPLHTLNEEMMVDILKKPKNAILKQFEQLFKVENCKLTITDEAIHQIAKQSISKDIGARGARSIIENLLLDALYEVPGSDICEVKITAEIVIKGEKPIFIRRGEK